ncbi:MAG TPA: type IV pilus assembly protein PilM [Pirellulales bacterium]|nr:type IV pilus assembly protein PilM [Pirellulales bacterium]
MAKSDAVWGIDIGQCALKALRCRPHEETSKITADAFDYIEYPKILSQPDVDPVELVRDALKQFLSRNSVRGDRVVVSVSGQSGLARFIKLPPVEAKKIPDIVKYEARQQIPFALEDVVWDFQTMIGGTVVEGFAMETEVGLFAMKRDQVYRALKPFNEAGIEVDIVQLTPLALYNFVAFDQMEDLPPPDAYDPDSPPPSVILISLGTDTTDLVVTNGFRVWQRNIPIGGNHFTKALTKELKLTFASAEHLKRNATQAEDPKALFQAMRPVFNDLLTEVQRSISFFSNLDRKAQISRAVALGNAMKLPGLQRYLAQNLGFDLLRLETFRGLSGSAVVDAPAFKENVPAFGVCYGLCLQALRETRIKTNLLPREILQDRMIREKRPWAVGAAAALLLGCGVSYFMHWVAARSVAMENGWKPVVDQAGAVVKKVGEYKSTFDAAKTKYSKTTLIGEGFIQNVVGRDMWLKLMKGINLCLPHSPAERPKDITQRNELNIEKITCVYYPDLAKWYADVKEFDKPLDQLIGESAPAAGATQPGAAGATGIPAAGATAAPPATGTAPAAATPAGATPPAAATPPGGTPPAAASPTATPPANGAAPTPGNAAAQPAAPAAAPPMEPPKGPGWVFELKGYHYHNPQGRDFGETFVARTLLKNLRLEEVVIPKEERWEGGPATFPLKKLGIGHSVLITTNNVNWSNELEVDDIEEGPENFADAKASSEKKVGRGPARPMPPTAPGAGGQVKRKRIAAPRYDFWVQFCWQVPPPATMVELATLYPGAGDPGNGPVPVAVPPAAAADAAPGAATEVPAPGAAENGASLAPPADGENPAPDEKSAPDNAAAPAAASEEK